MLNGVPFPLAALLPIMPPDAAAHGPALDHHLVLNLWIAAALLVLAHAVILVGLLRRRSDTAHNPRLTEYLPLAVFVLLFAFLGIRAERLWAATRYSGPDLAALQVEATGMQFAWYFRYPGQDYAFGHTKPTLADPGAGNPLGLDPADPRGADDFVTSQLVLPAGREVDLHLHAQDVIHGFSVPALRIKQNAVPGQDFHIHFTPTVPGTYAILCTQLCGSGHYRMTANLKVVSPTEYTAFLEAHRTGNP
jgi:cytochrome c oxidase subunit 2